MIFDKQSFLAGLHTGLRLGRDPIGRIPPPPHGRYIWTETEKNIITETDIVNFDCTIYNFGEIYPAIRCDYNNMYSGYSFIVEKVVWNREELRYDVVPSEAKFFWRDDYPTNPDMGPWNRYTNMVFYSPLENDLLAQQRVTAYQPDGTIKQYTVGVFNEQLPNNHLDRAGNYYVALAGYDARYWPIEPVPYPVIKNLTAYAPGQLIPENMVGEPRRYDVILEVFNQSGPEPLITE